MALKGLTIGSPQAGTTTELNLRGLLTANGINPDTDLVIAPSAEVSAMVPAAKAGRVDGFIFGPPTASLPVAEGFCRSR